MRARDGEHHGFARNAQAFQMMIAGKRAGKSEIDIAGIDRLKLLGRFHLHQFEFDLRYGSTRPTDEPRQETIGAGADKGDFHCPRTPACCPSCRGYRCIPLFKQFPGLRQKRYPCRRQDDAAAGSLEECDVEFLLQQLDLPAEWRLGHIQTPGRAAEIQLGGDGDK
ncbi:hypothetical protein D3C87_1396510 [compost metagenome]